MSSCKPLIVILSCYKNICRHVVYRNYFKQHSFDYLFVLGNSKKTYFKDDVLYVDVEDNYQSLSKKIAKVYEYIYKNYKKRNIIKIDDDTIIDLKKLKKINLDFDYGGFMAEGSYKESKYQFAFGGGYFLSYKALKVFVKNYKKYITNYEQEDRLVGISLTLSKNKLKIANNGNFLSNKDFNLFTTLFNTIIHPVSIKNIEKAYKSKLKNFFIRIQKD